VTTGAENGPDPSPAFCARCSAPLRPGSGDSYRVTIEAVADPAPPVLADKDPEAVRAEIERLLAALEGVSEREALEQVYRRLVLYLCVPCYRRWIEDPVGHRS
jgi:hypothetical protein